MSSYSYVVHSIEKKHEQTYSIHCLKCGRPLRNTESIERKFGPNCWNQHLKTETQQREL